MGTGINIPDSGTSISRFWILERVYVYNTGGTGLDQSCAIYIGNQNTGCTMRDVVCFNGTSGSAAGTHGLVWYGSDGRADNVFVGYYAGTGLYILGGTADETFVWRGGGVFTCNIGVECGGGGTVFEGTSIDHNQADGAYIADGPASFVDCTFHSNSLVGNGSNSNINIAGNNLAVSLLNCRAAPNDGYPNNPAYHVHVTGTGCTVNEVGSYNSGVSFTVGWTNYPSGGVSKVGNVLTSPTILTQEGGTPVGTILDTPLASSTALTINSATHTLLTSPSLDPGLWLVTAQVLAEYTTTTSTFIDFAVALGTAIGTLGPTPAGGMSQPASTTEYLCTTLTITVPVVVTTAGTVILEYESTSTGGGATALKTGINTNLGSSTGITAVKIVGLV